MAYIDNVTKILQIQPDGLPTFVRLSQNENGRNLNFQLAGNEIDIPSNATVTISGTKPDGNVYSGTGSVSDNVVLIPEMLQMTAVAGTWDAKVKITSGGNTIATGRVRFVVDADTVDPDAVPSSSELEGLVAEAQQYAETARTEAYGSPLTASAAADMTDHTRVYVYTGSETGYTAGHWYYWDGSAWTDGGIYNSVAVNTDPTLTLTGVAADAKAAGDAIDAAVSDLKSDLSDINDMLDVQSISGDKDSVPTAWRQNSIFYVTGANSTSSAMVRTDYFAIDEYTKINVPEPYACAVFAYDETKAYLGAYNPTNNTFSNASNPFVAGWAITGAIDMQELAEVRSVISGMESAVPDQIILVVNGTTNQNLDEVSNLTFETGDSNRILTLENKTDTVIETVDKLVDGTSYTCTATKVGNNAFYFQLINGRKYAITNNSGASINAYYINADDSVTVIFTSIQSDKTGTFTCDANDHKGLRMYFNQIGTATVDSEDDGIFDAVNGLSDRIDAIGLPTYEYTSVSLFNTFGVIGDSFSSGGILSESGTSIVNCYPVSWPQILARKAGIEATNYSSTGADIANFLRTTSTMSSWKIDKLESDAPRDLYVIMMGINAEKSLSDASATVSVGTVSDIDINDYTNNADTFCGHYGQMLTRMIAHAPTSKIILVVPPLVSAEKETAIRNIATLYGIPVFKATDDSYYKTAFYNDNKEISHPTAPSYAGMANAFARQIAECIVDNVSYFNTYRPLT